MDKQCRICLLETCKLDCISLSNKLNEETTLFEAILSISSVQILENDLLPQLICSQCYIKLDQFYTFRNLIISSDKELKEQHNNFQDNHETSLNNFQIYGEEVEGPKKVQYLGCNKVVENNDAGSIESSDEVHKESNTILLNNCNNIGLDLIKVPQKTNTRKNQVGKVSKRCKTKNSKLKKKHECLECGKLFNKADHLNVHIAYKHSEKQFKCLICNKKFARKYDLAYHNRVHSGERPFTCELCGKSFASSSYFYMHKRMHTGDKKMKCHLCQNSFINSDQIQIHIRQKHTGERPFMCELCSHAFSSSSALFRHKRDVHDQKVECPICKKLYSSRVLKDHIQRHKEREEGIKRFICDLCGKRFTCATSRKRHLVIHSGEKAFKCEVCDKAFNQRSTLQTHKRIHSQVMPFQCDICSKNFRYKHHLKLHREKHHKADECLDSKDMYEIQGE